MAEHDGAAEETESVDAPVLFDEESEALDVEIDAEEAPASTDFTDSQPKRSLHEWFSGTRGLVAASFVAIVALVGAGVWLGFRLHQDDHLRAQRGLYVQVARQTAI